MTLHKTPQHEHKPFERLIQSAKHPLWRPWIDEIWVAHPTTRERDALILPDNCMDILWRDGQGYVVGACTQAFYSTMSPGQNVYGVRFKPGVLALISQVSATELLDEVVCLNDIWREDVMDGITKRLCALQGDVRLEVLKHCMHTQADDVASLARELGWSTRHVRRVLTPWFGYSVRTWLQIRRFGVMRQAFEQYPLWSCAEVAAQAGYADQAHMNRMCKRLALGHTPHELRDVLSAHRRTEFNENTV